MTKDEQTALLKRSVKEWNEWRQANIEVAPDLTGADLSQADLSGADLSQADFSGADLSRTNLREANLSQARYDKATKWPDNFDPTQAGAICED